MRSWLGAVGIVAASIAPAWTGPGLAEGRSLEASAPESVRVLEVPYVPQSGSLCGGAALAMVLRYWGQSGVFAGDFAGLVEPGEAGIRTGVLVNAVEALGWTAVVTAGPPVLVADHLARGHPVIALIRARSSTLHYVVLVARANGWVVLHDPNVAPYRAIREAEFDAAWADGGNWALVVLPPPVISGPAPPDSPAVAASPPRTAPGECDDRVEAGILLARQGNTVAAESEFLAAQALCPRSSAPLRERAGLRFRAEDWAAANRLAMRAVAMDPDDSHAWRLLAASRFLAGDEEGALTGWNHVAEPRIDLTNVDGLKRMRHSAVVAQLALRPGRILTARDFRRAQRRLSEMPAQVRSRLSLRPEAGGIVQVNVSLLERPPAFGALRDFGSAGIQAATRREISIDVPSPTGNGELWTAGWRWWTNRPRVSLALIVPAAGGRPGIWRLEGYWERQAYSGRRPSDAAGSGRAEIKREERRRTALSFSDWLGPDVRLEVGAAMDTWADRGTHLSAEAGVETRWGGDRLALGARAGRWFSLASGTPFDAGDLSLAWCSSGLAACDAWQGRVGLAGATADAPLALWPGAGTGNARAPLLRAHPLLFGGVVEGRVFGRSLLHGTIERQMKLWNPGPLRFGWAVFVDGARAWHTGPVGGIPWQVDGGTGLRLQGPGLGGGLRIDVARGFEDGSSAVSVGWETR